MRVIVTRPGPQAGKWVNALRDAGHDAIAFPLIDIAPAADSSAVQATWHRLHEFDAVMFVSANAVAHFFALRPLESKAPVPLNPQQRFLVTGPGSALALERAGVLQAAVDAPAADATQFDSEALWQVVEPKVRKGWCVLIVRGDTDADSEQDTDSGVPAKDGKGVGREWFAARLLEKGAAVEYVVSYQRRAPQPGADAIALMQGAATDGAVWLFTSSEAVANLKAMAPGQSWQQARALASHPRIADAAREAGFGVVCESRPALSAVIASIESMA